MVEVNCFAHGDGTLHLNAEGHAGAGRMGEDVVCAGISALVCTLGEAVWRLYEQGMLERVPRVEIETGTARIIAQPKAQFRESTLMAFWMAELGLGMLMQAYPDNCRMEEMMQILPESKKEQ